MNEITVFQNPSFGSVRTFLRNGDPWFVASDVAKALGYTNPQKAIVDHCKYAELLKGNESLPLTDSPRGINIIPESDVYALIFRSNLPKAEEFRRWVCEEVLPSIRKTGQYGVAAVAYSVDDQLAGAARIFNEAGITGNQRVLAMDKLYRQITGRSAIETTQLQLVSPMQEALLTPTQLGQMMTPVRNARSVNQFLLDLGFQRKTCSGWEPTEAGLAAGATLLDVGKSHSNGTPVTQLKWRSSVLRRLM